MEIDRVTADHWSDHHWQPQQRMQLGTSLGEDRHRFVDVLLWQLFPDGLQGGFQLISRLMLRLQLMVLMHHGAPDVIVQRVQIWRV